MTKKPIAIISPSPEIEIPAFARLRFGKVLRIECNVEVEGVGLVAPEDRTKLAEYFHDEMDNSWKADDVGIGRPSRATRHSV
jgi:hypothetical protein